MAISQTKEPSAMDAPMDAPIDGRLADAISRGQDYLLSQQSPEGYWWAELEANVTLTAEYVMLHRILGTDRDQSIRGIRGIRGIRAAARYLLREQRDHGGWELFFGDGGELSTTIEAYWALKLSGLPATDKAMVKARQFVLARGGLSRARVFTKIHLALFGVYPWQGIPTLPPWFILLPRWFPLNIYEMSSWARSSTVPLLIVCDHKPVYFPGFDADELYTERPGQRTLDLENPDGSLIGSLFLAADQLLKLADDAGAVPFRDRSIAAAERWIIERQDTPGDWAGIIPAMLNSTLAFHVLGYANEHPYVKRGIEAIERFGIHEGDGFRLQPCLSPTWDTALAITALVDSGLRADDPRLRRAAEWLLSKQIFHYGDWSFKNRKGKPAGWAFEFFNDFYPDVDDTAAVVMALLGVSLEDERVKLEACRAAIDWVMSMQCKAGGWAAFDVDNTRNLFNRMPYGDLKAMIDPPTADLTGRVLEMLGMFEHLIGERRYSDGALRSALNFLVSRRESDGSWWGRWGVNYIYGTYLVLVGLRTINSEPMSSEVEEAVAWLRRVQNSDGGWGETCESYNHPELKAQGSSTPSQTAWALLGLMAAGDFGSAALMRGINFLLERQNPDGSWPEPEFTGTGFPGHFYINYHQYRNQFPLTALGRFAARRPRDVQ
jgi:squalene-hopene/tetraprenyl-beta-curcumene cyclase